MSRRGVDIADGRADRVRVRSLLHRDHSALLRRWFERARHELHRAHLTLSHLRCDRHHRPDDGLPVGWPVGDRAGQKFTGLTASNRRESIVNGESGEQPWLGVFSIPGEFRVAAHWFRWTTNHSRGPGSRNAETPKGEPHWLFSPPIADNNSPPFREGLKAMIVRTKTSVTKIQPAPSVSSKFVDSTAVTDI